MIRKLVFLLALAGCVSTPNPDAFDPAKLREIDAAIETAISSKRLPGGVLWIERDGSTYTRAYGNRAVEPAVEKMTADTIFDAASITKVIATAPSIWLLIERGKIALDTPVRTYLPEFTDDAVTLRHLLTHTSGLRPSLDLHDPWSGYDEGIRRALAETPRNRPGAIFRYSDINYILLGEIVRRVSGEPLEIFARKNIFEPLGMRDTGFWPNGSPRIAPTERMPDDPLAPTPLILRGVVHDPTARRMGGVAGHAGMFTTVEDLARFARAVLRGDFFPRAMTQVNTPEGVAVRRAGGFDVDSAYSRPRGEYFPAGISFGHTGWTGGFLWIDPQSRAFYIFLSNRVHPDGKGSVVALQRQLGTLVAQSLRGVTHARQQPRVGWIIGGADAQNGIDVLHATRYQALRGLRVGLITNHTGVDRAGNPTIDLLRSAPGVTLAALFSPEHGIRGDADAKIGDDSDPVTKLPIYSLYGERRAPSPEQLAGLDALVFDIQDIGARFYTYISTMGMAMESAAKAKIKFIVLDRVNPIGADVVEGPILEGETNFIGWHTIPVRHGMTVGELARMFRDERGIDVDLTVVPVRGWTRDQWQDQAGLPWVNTSPNIRSLNAAALYPGLGLLERAISVGRGTDTPFEIIGAPYIDGNQLVRELQSVPGVSFQAIRFTPAASTHKGEPCGGVRITISDRKVFRPVDVGVTIASTLARLYPAQFKTDDMAHLLRHRATLEAIRAGQPLDRIRALWDTDAFLARRAKYLLYDGQARADRERLAAEVREEFLHAWRAYEKYAWGHDELRPVSKTPRDWHAESLLITPVDTLDTLLLMGLDDEAKKTRDLIAEKLSFDKDIVVKNFEITIRVLGGLLSGYQLTGDERLLRLADDLGSRLLPVFDSPTGLPYMYVNLKTGKVSGAKTNPAEIGTLLLEFGTLAKLTGKNVYYDKAKNALVQLYARRTALGLVGEEIDVETGKWVSTASHVGGGIDSYYEYLLKCARLFGDRGCESMYRESVRALNEHLAEEAPSGLWYGQVDAITGARTAPEFGALHAFLPSVLALGGDLGRARKLQDSCEKMWKLHGIEPEVVDYRAMRVVHAGYPLRPEIIESAWYLYHFTKDPRYVQMGAMFFEDLKRHCRTEAGYTNLKSVVTKEKADLMPSYFLAETLKYLYLLFADDERFDLEKVVFTTEAHPLRP